MASTVYRIILIMATNDLGMTPEERFAQDVLRAISRERLERYRPPSGPDLEMLTNYYWNILLCEALYPSLNCAEVALRNTIHTTLSDFCRTEYWFDDANLVYPEQYRDAREARAKLARRRQAVTAGRIVAELSFGFWVQMLAKRYEARIWMPGQFALMQRAFPNVSRRSRNLHSIHTRFWSINLLRNRVFHFEPVWHDRELQQKHADIVAAIGWISSGQQAAERLLDRFPETYRDGRLIIRSRIEGYLQGLIS